MPQILSFPFFSVLLNILLYIVLLQVEKPIFLPCFGLYRREKHILLPLVTDVAIEQGIFILVSLRVNLFPN